ncbi:NYN domain-containing protein [Salinisphaera sp.]|uniref:NYN domain-containing protein n=1 Tax=Salinisphaera sp. TaxID=1914330 RepID=UPI000C386F31|nr:NYN domain-containing protein [Salinisphaera sp.]MAS10378.1 NYN domain-containing protein [Salinisphaera sp.]|tara:strand:- start:3927 stop:4547 length:621 start_codon:yes stop_codon:yes gene_type:complete
MTRVASYIDGFNLYFGLKSKHWKRYYWLDLWAMPQALLKPGQQLVASTYFTSRIRNNGINQADMDRQSDYLDALSTNPNLSIREGHFLEKPRRCRACGATWTTYEEKMTDVNIATALLSDAHRDEYDTALIISGDSDLTPPIREVRRVFPHKRLIVAFPPNRHSQDLRRAAHGFIAIGADTLRQNQLPAYVTMPNGHVIHRPATWK